MKKHLLASFAALLVCLLSFSQSATLKGTVRDTLGNPVFNTRIFVDELGRGAVSDLLGQYQINDIPAGQYTVIFRNLEFKTMERRVSLATGETLVLDVTLSNEKQFDEVVIIGYGSTRTTDLTGAASMIKEENFLKGNLATPEQLIMGKAAGVKVNTNDGAPGSGSTIRLRGGTSINASNDPLIVVDGVPLDNGGIAGSANALSLINPDDIASFVILKDASATAIYGSRGANGVILITTKKGTGREDRLRVNWQSNTSLMTVARYADVLSADEFRRLVSEKGTPAQAALLGNANTDWQREVFRNALTTDNNISVSGGIKSLPYRFSYGNRTEQGLLRRDLFIRNSVALNFTPRFLDNHLDIEFNNRLAQTANNFANRGALGAAYFDPTQPVYSGNDKFGGYFEWLNSSGTLPIAIAPRNPVGLLYQREDKSQVYRYIGNLKATYKLPFFPDVRTTVNFGLDRAQSSGWTATPNTSASGALSIGGLGSWNEYRQTKGNKLFEAYVNYNNASKESKHLIDFMVGYSAQDWFTMSPNLPVYSFNKDTIIVPANPYPFETRNALMSIFSRAIYTYDNRYVLNAALRRDGSSRFSQAQRWGMFPSLSAAWVISNEKFMERDKTFNMLKLRAGWGVTGQQDGIGDYAYIGNYYPGANTAQYFFGNQFVPVLRPDGFDANLKWETTSSINVGFDFGIKNDRFNGTIDFYRKNTRDLLAVVPVPAGSNFTNQILTNVGSMRNQGVEITASYGIIAKKDMRLNVNANATYNKNTVLKLSQIDDPNSPGVLVGGIAGGIGNTIQVHQLGYPTFSFLVYEQRYDANGRPIEVGAANPNGGVYTETDAFVDRNGDGIINIDDRYIFPQAAPLWFLGMAFDFTYKRWFASLSMRSELGGYIYNNIHSNNGTFQAINGTQGFLNNLSTLYFNEEFQKTTERQLLSDHYIERADFLRLDYVNFGYDFGRLKRFKDQMSFRAGFTVSNVLVITKYQGLDPEINGGIDNNIYPRPRVFTLNLTFNF
jgi:iron complex outermembrane receptor protein